MLNLISWNSVYINLVLVSFISKRMNMTQESVFSHRRNKFGGPEKGRFNKATFSFTSSPLLSSPIS